MLNAWATNLFCGCVLGPLSLGLGFQAHHVLDPVSKILDPEAGSLEHGCVQYVTLFISTTKVSFCLS
jgi:hypothetical protein